MQNSGDPESDPYMTPGSVLGSPGPPTLNDSDHQLLRDNIGMPNCLFVIPYSFYLFILIATIFRDQERTLHTHAHRKQRVGYKVLE